MKMYLMSLGAGILVGIVYSLLNVRSPAPPIVALLGLLGMLIGEQAIPVCKHLISGTAFSTACEKAHTVAHLFGALPGRPLSASAPKSEEIST